MTIGSRNEDEKYVSQKGFGGLPLAIFFEAKQAGNLGYFLISISVFAGGSPFDRFS